MSITKSELTHYYWAKAVIDLDDKLTAFVVDLSKEYEKPPVATDDFIVGEGYIFKEDGSYLLDYFSCGYGKEKGKWSLHDDILTIHTPSYGDKKKKILSYEPGKTLVFQEI